VTIGKTKSIVSDILVFAIGVAVGLAFMYYDQGSRSAALRQSEQDIGEALRQPGIPIAAVAEEIRSLERTMGLAINDYERRIKALELAKSQAQDKRVRVRQTPDQIRIAAALTCIDDAVRALDAAAPDPDFSILNKVFALRAALESTRQDLASLAAGPDVVPGLLDRLERGRFDHVLTTPSFLQTYFLDKSRWQGLHLAYRSIETLLTGLLQSKGVAIVRIPILSVVNASEIRHFSVEDRRNVRRIPAVRETAARAARDLDASEYLVVDCHAPGWVSTLPIGNRPPSFALFERSSWT
jgi:hypothetical protein